MKRVDSLYLNATTMKIYLFSGALFRSNIASSNCLALPPTENFIRSSTLVPTLDIPFEHETLLFVTVPEGTHPYGFFLHPKKKFKKNSIHSNFGRHPKLIARVRFDHTARVYNY